MPATQEHIVVVTGGCGFIGSHLTRRLVESGRRVRVVDDLSNGDPGKLVPGVDFRRGDVADPAFIRSAVADASVVFHLAAVASVQRSNDRWLDSHHTNVGGTVALLEALRDTGAGAAFVYASSAAVYGDVGLGPGQRIAEDAHMRPLTPYGIDKLASEMNARVAGSLFGIPSLGLRFFNVFGPGQAPDSPYSGVISRFLAQALAGEQLTIYGDGSQTRDFVQVDDIIGALLLAERAASVDGHVVNICTGRPTTVADLARTVVGLAGGRGAVVHEPERPGDIKHSLGNPALAAELLGWRPEIDVEEGLEALVRVR